MKVSQQYPCVQCPDELISLSSETATLATMLDELLAGQHWNDPLTSRATTQLVTLASVLEERAARVAQAVRALLAEQPPMRIDDAGQAAKCVGQEVR